jgi:23S rRNA pseudouridine1911/1915/1917 synthase
MMTRLLCDTDGERTDVFLARVLPPLSRSAAQRLLREGQVLRGGVPLRKQDLLRPGDEISVCIPEPASAAALPEDIPLDVVYEDDDLIVINKPVGMVVHPAPGHPGGTLVNALLYHCGDTLSGIGGELRPGIVHRIDRDTSGLLVAAKNDRAHGALSAQLADHSLHRVYEAVVCGNLKEDAGLVDIPIGRSPKDRKKMAADRVNGREAVTHWRVLARLRGYTHVECRLETGRTHQIRVHFASIGHPLLGDRVYGGGKPYPGLPGQCLHAKELRFVHPRSGEQMTLTAALPAYFSGVLAKLQGQW